MDRLDAVSVIKRQGTEGKHPRTIDGTVSSEQLGFCFSLFYRFRAVRQIKLAISSAF